MAGDTTTTDAGFFRQRFSKHLAKDTQNASPMLAMIERYAQEETTGGASNNVKWAHEQYRGVGMSALSENGDYATAAASKAVQPYLGLSHFSFAVDWTGHVEAQGSSTEDGWVDAGSWRQKKARDLRDTRRSFLSRVIMHDGTANWGQVVAVSGTTDGYITVTGVPIHFFIPGETLTIRDTSSSGTEQLTNSATGAGLIKDVDYENERVYMADVSGAAADDYIAISGFYDATMPNGIKNIIDSAGTIHGLARGTVGNFMLRATEQAVTGSLGASDVDILRDAVDDVARLRGLKYESTWACNRASRRAMALATIGQNRFTDLDLKMGVPKMKINDRNGTRTVVEDPYFLFGELYCTSFEKWIKATPSGTKGGYPVKNGDSVLWPATATTGTGYSDRRIMYWVERRNWGCRDFRCQGKRTGWSSP